MAELVNCASIFQLAFAVNAAVPAVFLAYRRMHQSIAERFARSVQKVDATFTFDDYEMSEFRRYVRGSANGLKIADRVKVVPIGLFSIALVISFVGLVLTATRPQFILHDEYVWAFSIFALAVCPLVGLAYEMFLSFTENLIAVNWAKHREFANETAVYFRLWLDTQRDLDLTELKTMLRETERRVMKFAIDMKVFTLKNNLRMLRYSALQRCRSFKEWFDRGAL